ncbi:MAG: recombination mediator RecR [Candidatus Paceibacterota bacterium]
MSNLPKDLQHTIEFFEKLPGIGPKTAKRLGFYLLRLPQADLEEAADHLKNLKKSTMYCKHCLNLSEAPLCPICADSSRDTSIIAIVEDVLDLLSMEMGHHYKGLYHVLHGRIDPLNYIGPDDIYIPQLLKRVKKDKSQLKEIILATNPDTEGEATAMYLKKKLEEVARPNGSRFAITRLGFGLPIGADLEYADYQTLKKAMEGRKAF